MPSRTPFSYVCAHEQRAMVEAVLAKHEIVFGTFREPVPSRYYRPEPYEGKRVRVYTDIPARNAGFLTAEVMHVRKHKAARSDHVFPASWSVTVSHATRYGGDGWDLSVSFDKCPIAAMKERVRRLIAEHALGIDLIPFPWEPNPQTTWEPAAALPA